MPLSSRTALAAGCLCLLPQCSGRDDTFLSWPSSELELVSFNAALGTGLAPYTEQRLAAIERDLPGLGADVVCVQEVWQPEMLERLAASVAADLPFAYWSVREASRSQAACSSAEAASLSECLLDNCAGIEGGGLALCAVNNCAGVFSEVSTACQQCIAANQAATDVSSLSALCAAADGEAVAYADQTGLVLLSRLPLAETSYVAFESSLGDRGVLSARLHSDVAGPVDVFCTHLAASLGEVPYRGRFGSWEGERLQQIGALLARVAEERAPGGAVAVLGDMNCGPETSGAEAAGPLSFQRFVSAGFESPYAASDGRCTFCSQNPLNAEAVAERAGELVGEGVILDHVLLDGFDRGLLRSGRRVFDEPIEIAELGASIETARSDHYGVAVTLSLVPEPAGCAGVGCAAASAP